MINLTINGSIYSFPEEGDENWGDIETSAIQALVNNTLFKSGGNFFLSDDVSFGSNFGLLVKYIKSVSSNIAESGTIRLANGDTIAFRNYGDSADLSISVNSSNKLLFNGSEVIDAAKFDANTILAANTDDTPVALTISENTIVGRKTGGNIASLSIADILDMIYPKGIVSEYAGSSAPAGWLMCDGSAISRATYSGLFAVIGETWGVGDGSTTFNVPDMRGATPRGVGTSTVFTDNSKAVALGEVINDAFQGHFHNVYTAGLGENAVIVTRAGVGATTSELAAGNSGTGTVDGLRVAAAISNGTNGTPRKGNETTGKARGINFIIKY